MSRKTTLISLIVIAIIGSFMAALASNMFFADVGNIGVPFSEMTLFSTFTSLTLAAELVAVFLYVIRLYQRPKTFKRMSIVYIIIALCLSSIGFLSALLSGILEYGSFVKLYPFPGYLIIFMITHLLVIGGAIFSLIRLRKVAKDEERFKVKVGHVFKTLGWFLFISLTYNRLGMFLGSPVFIEWRTLYMTFPFYLYLLVPAFLGTLKVLAILGYLNNKKLDLALCIAAVALQLVLFIVIAIIGTQESLFVAGISQCMPLSRLASKPVEILIHFMSLTAVSVILLVQSIKRAKAKE